VHVNSIKGYVFYSSVLWGAKRDGQGYDADWLNSLAAEAIEGLHWRF
jgi:hypothetical protein